MSSRQSGETHVKHAPRPDSAVLIAAHDAALAIQHRRFALVALTLVAGEGAKTLARGPVEKPKMRVER